MTQIRKQFTLSSEQASKLERLATALDLSQSHLIRLMVDRIEEWQLRQLENERKRGWKREDLYEERMAQILRP